MCTTWFAVGYSRNQDQVLRTNTCGWTEAQLKHEFMWVATSPYMRRAGDHGKQLYYRCKPAIQIIITNTPRITITDLNSDFVFYWYLLCTGRCLRSPESWATEEQTVCDNWAYRTGPLGPKSVGHNTHAHTQGSAGGWSTLRLNTIVLPFCFLTIHVGRPW